METHQVDIQSLYIFCNGYELVGANRKPYTADTPRRIYSAAKALTGLAVLFAVQEDCFPWIPASRSSSLSRYQKWIRRYRKRRIEMLTIRHLMTMTTGHDRDTFRPILNGTRSVEAFLQEPLDFEPGTHFLYNNGVPHILGMAVERTAGMNYIEYLRPRLLEPLKIFCTVEKTEKGELEGSRTVCTAEGFAKLTLFYLRRACGTGRSCWILHWFGQPDRIRYLPVDAAPFPSCTKTSSPGMDTRCGGIREKAIASTAAGASLVSSSRRRVWLSCATPLRRTAA